MKWISFTENEQLLQLINDSNKKPQLIFKHSTGCGISRMVLKSFEREFGLNEQIVACYYLDLLNYRAISNAIAKTLNIQHQSPQALIIKEGKVIYAKSHEQIDAQEIETLISN